MNNHISPLHADIDWPYFITSSGCDVDVVAILLLSDYVTMVTDEVPDTKSGGTDVVLPWKFRV